MMPVAVIIAVAALAAVLVGLSVRGLRKEAERDWRRVRGIEED